MLHAYLKKHMSPLLFIIFVADLDLWLAYSKISSYADDTKTSVSGRILKAIIRKMECDARMVLKFMASNGLVANPKKPPFYSLILRKRIRPVTSQSKLEKRQSFKNTLPNS